MTRAAAKPRFADRQERRKAPPLDQAALERLALRYVERFATSRGKLADYLARKLRERGGEGPVDPQAAAARMEALGYVDDAAFAEARARALARRGMGSRRVVMALRQAHIADDRIAGIVEAAPDVEAALAFARRKRIGPFAAAVADRPLREKQVAAMIRAGHPHRLARRIAGLPPGADIAAEALDGE